MKFYFKFTFFLMKMQLKISSAKRQFCWRCSVINIIISHYISHISIRPERCGIRSYIYSILRSRWNGRECMGYSILAIYRCSDAARNACRDVTWNVVKSHERHDDSNRLRFDCLFNSLVNVCHQRKDQKSALLAAQSTFNQNTVLIKEKSFKNIVCKYPPFCCEPQMC